MLTITDADRALAAELGLTFVQAAETDRDRAAAADPRATRLPESWWIKTVHTNRPVGFIHFTPVDCLYATKIATGITGPEETVAGALRALAPVRRHARTGAYEGTETVGGKLRPRALTECGAPATGGDYNAIAARTELRDGRVPEMCPACRTKLEGQGVRDLSRLPGRRGSASAKQCAFLRRLLDEGACAGRPHLMDARQIDQMSSREASAKIDELIALKARAWKGDL